MLNVKLSYDNSIIRVWKAKNIEHAFQDVLAYVDSDKEYSFAFGKSVYNVKHRKITKQEKKK